MFDSKRYFIAFMLFIFAVQTTRLTSQIMYDETDEIIRRWIENIKVSQQNKSFTFDLMAQFYEGRGYQPVWFKGNKANNQIHELIHAVELSTEQGLLPEDYRYHELKKIQMNLSKESQISSWQLARTDLLFTEIFFLLSHHILAGKINPSDIEPDWVAAKREKDLVQLLRDALNKQKVYETLQDLQPEHKGYSTLIQALKKYRNFQNSETWEQLTLNQKIEPGDRGEIVIRLRKRFETFLGNNTKQSALDSVYDESLVRIVTQYQKEHGLEQDGIVGPSTLKAMNTTVNDRIEQIILNMERWRWLPQHLGTGYVLVNIANFELELIEQEHTVLSLRVIVGKPFRKTPVFSDHISYLVLCPFWTVPLSIATKDILPILKKDIQYLSEKRMRVFSRQGFELIEQNPIEIRWQDLSEKHFPYILRQDPGPLNALGHIKFMFPNAFNVYLHDTPSKEMFQRNERIFSSGCIRVENPLLLAEHLLKDTQLESRASIEAVITKGIEQTVQLSQKVPVHLLYWTAWAEEDGTVQFRNDIYERDVRLANALKAYRPVYSVE